MLGQVESGYDWV